jgi:hypothetical protein
MKTRLLHAFFVAVVMPLRQLETAGFSGRFRQQVFNLRVDTAQVVVGPFFQRLKQFCVKAEKVSLLCVHDRKMTVKDLQEE